MKINTSFVKAVSYLYNTCLQMKAFPLNICSILVVIVFISFVLFIHHNLFTKVAHLRDHTNSTKTKKNKTTDFSSVFTKFSTSNITTRLDNRNRTSSARIKRFPIFDGGGVVKVRFLKQTKKCIPHFIHIILYYSSLLAHHFQLQWQIKSVR